MKRRLTSRATVHHGAEPLVIFSVPAGVGWVSLAQMKRPIDSSPSHCQ